MNSILQRIKLAASNVQQVDDEGYEEIEPKEKGYITNQMRDLYIQQQQEQQEKEQSENNQTTKSKGKFVKMDFFLFVEFFFFDFLKCFFWFLHMFIIFNHSKRQTNYLSFLEIA